MLLPSTKAHVYLPLSGCSTRTWWGPRRHIFHAGYAAFSSPAGPTGLGLSDRATVSECCPRHVVLCHHTELLWYDYRLNPPGKGQSKTKDKKQKQKRRGGGVRSSQRNPMNGGGTRQLGGVAGGVGKNPIIDQIMLRFKPIAPKPAAGESSSGVLTAGGKGLLVSGARKKRKYTRVKNRSGIRRKKTRSEKERNDAFQDTVVTLQLLPEKTETREKLEPRFLRELNRAIISETVTDGWGPLGRVITGKQPTNSVGEDTATDPPEAKPPTKFVESWVTVERVTDTCMDARALGRTDVERWENLEKDTCPGFISDGWDRVRCVNGAYRKLVTGDDNSLAQITAWLVTKDKLPYIYPAFTCRVMLRYTWRDQGDVETRPKTKTLAAPCDGWRMDCGGVAWRLDIDAALSLAL